MKKKLFGLTVAVVMVLSINVVAFAGGSGPPWPPEPWSPPVCGLGS